MGEKLTKDMMITIGMCDHTGRLGVPQCFEQCMNIATEHAAALGLGVGALGKQHLFWLAVRTKLRFYSLPAIEEQVRFTTWPEAPNRLRSNRSYRMEQDGKILFEGKTEWTILNTETNALVPGTDVYSADLDFEPASALDLPFARVRDNFGEIAPFAQYTVRSTDIDLGGHMNNSAYIRALMGAFDTKTLDALSITEMDVRYVAPTFEGETICFQRRDTDTGLEIRSAVDDRTVLLVSLSRR